MTNAIQALNYNGSEIRMTEIDGEPWWVAKDVCSVLQIQNTTQAIQALDDDERAMCDIGRQGSTNVINEAGLYQLIFKSVKPEAKAFKRWVTHEVLPAIRRDGVFMAAGVVAPEVAEIAALEYRVAAARKRLEARELECRAQLVNRIEGSVAIVQWVKENCPNLNTKQSANVSRSIKRAIINQLRKAVGAVKGPGGGKVMAARPSDIEAAFSLIQPNRPELQPAR